MSLEQRSIKRSEMLSHTRVFRGKSIHTHREMLSRKPLKQIFQLSGWNAAGDQTSASPALRIYSRVISQRCKHGTQRSKHCRFSTLHSCQPRRLRCCLRCRRLAAHTLVLKDVIEGRGPVRRLWGPWCQLSGSCCAPVILRSAPMTKMCLTGTKTELWQPEHTIIRYSSVY